MITFRDGPTGRRAGLITDPDVWEIVMWIDDVSGLKDPAKTLAQEGVVTRAQTDAALRYRAAYPEEMGPRDQRDSDHRARPGRLPRPRRVRLHRRQALRAADSPLIWLILDLGLCH
jgi:hypothetical protein